MYRNDVFEKIVYIMKNIDKKDRIRPNFAKMAKSMGCCTEFWLFFKVFFLFRILEIHWSDTTLGLR